MSQNDPTNDGRDFEELRILTDRCLDERHSEDDIQRLESLLLDDATAQDHYLDACQLHSLITLSNGTARVVEQVRLQLNSKELKSSDSKPHLLPWPTHWRRGQRLFAAIAAVALAAALLIAMGGVWLMTGDRSGLPTIASSPHAQEVFQQVAFDFGPGAEELKLGEFGTAVLEGPGRAEWLSPKRIRLDRGRMRVRIDQPEGHGFIVDTPGTSVADLGTEFAVDVSQDQSSTIVVFDGVVDLSYAGESKENQLQSKRLYGGDGVLVSATGNLQRLMSIVTGRNCTFTQMADYAEQLPAPLILNVEDNLLDLENKRFYEIVPGGLREDAKAYADRPQHEWNGIDHRGLPNYLLAIDYIKTYNGDKRRRHLTIDVTVSRPANMYVFFDARLPAPDWLTNEFRDTGDKIGLDMGQWTGPDGILIIKEKSGVGPGASIDAGFSVWVRRVEQAGVVRLGSSAGRSGLSAMYGIAVAEIEED